MTNLLHMLLRPDVIWVLIPLAAIIVWGVAGIVHQVHRHQERLAMIERGMDPDAHKRPQDASDSADRELSRDESW